MRGERAGIVRYPEFFADEQSVFGRRLKPQGLLRPVGLQRRRKKEGRAETISTPFLFSAGVLMKRFMPVLISLVLFLFVVSPAGGEQHLLRILYVNDFHGFAEPYKPLGSDKLQGGIAYLAGEVRRLRAEMPSLLLAAGDMIQGNNWTNFFKGESAIEMICRRQGA